MTKTDLINAIKAIDLNAKTSGLDKDELQALLTELQDKATIPEQDQSVAAESTPVDQAADTSSAVVNENPALVNNSGENVNENPETVNSSGDVVNNGAEVVNPEQVQAAAAESTPADPAEDTSSAVVNENPGDSQESFLDSLKNPVDFVSSLDGGPMVLDDELSKQPNNVPRETDLEKKPIGLDAKGVYFVSEGKAITSKRGILPAGEAVQARDFIGGEETLNSLLDRGLIE